MLTNREKFNYFLLCAFIGLWLCKRLQPKKDELILGGVAISRTPCVSVVNDLFGKGVDSSKACDCLLPGYYELVKNDPVELAKFNQTGIHLLSGASNDRLNHLFSTCIGGHIIDSTYTMQSDRHLPGTLPKSVSYENSHPTQIATI
jgi:hypothetical protein